MKLASDLMRCGSIRGSTPTSSLGNISQQLGITGGNLQAPGLVQLNIVGNNGGSAALGLQNLIQVFHDTQIQFEDNVIYTHGRHQIKTGFQYVRERQDYIYQGNNGALGYLGLGTAYRLRTRRLLAGKRCRAEPVLKEILAAWSAIRRSFAAMFLERLRRTIGA